MKVPPKRVNKGTHPEGEALAGGKHLQIGLPSLKEKTFLDARKGFYKGYEAYFLYASKEYVSSGPPPLRGEGLVRLRFTTLVGMELKKQDKRKALGNLSHRFASCLSEGREG